jgi:hypothetical protein
MNFSREFWWHKCLQLADLTTDVAIVGGIGIGIGSLLAIVTGLVR